MSNRNRWDSVYAGMDHPIAYGDDTTYRLGAEFLAGCTPVEDWGCGGGWFRQFLPRTCSYVGVDGSRSPFADRIADLDSYRSDVPGLFMRHVLEHNPGWRTILENALTSFRERFALVLFTPLAEHETELARCGRTGVPDLSLPGNELRERLGTFDVTEQEVRSETHYGAEIVFFIASRVS